METEEVTSELTPEQIEQVRQKRLKEAAELEATRLNKVLDKVYRDVQRQQKKFPDLTNPVIYQYHAQVLVRIANDICLRQQRRKFEIDGENRDLLRFLLYYFNDCHLAEEVFPDKDYKLEKNLLIMGKAGAGKTLMMQIFSEYLKYTDNPNFFHNLSVTQMVNYYTIHNNLDRYTYNEENSTGFMPQPVNICLNDIGMQSRLHYGQDTKILTIDFLHARNEIWTQSAPDRRKFAHLTTNLSIAQLKEEFKDDFGRLIDRFKTYNVIELKGTSRR